MNRAVSLRIPLVPPIVVIRQSVFLQKSRPQSECERIAHNGANEEVGLGTYHGVRDGVDVREEKFVEETCRIERLDQEEGKSGGVVEAEGRGKPGGEFECAGGHATYEHGEEGVDKAPNYTAKSARLSVHCSEDEWYAYRALEYSGRRYRNATRALRW